MKISIGCDHAAYELKQKVKQYLTTKNIEVNDFGCHSEERCDYPDFAHAVAEDVTNQNCDFGILICGSGNGISMTANKWPGVRSAVCWNLEIAHMARLHNDANILTLPARYISDEEAIKCVDEFIEIGFEGGRHSDRIAKIDKVEDKFEYGSFEYGGNSIPLTKEGYPNCKYLDKFERGVVKEFLTSLRKQKHDVLMEELNELLMNLETNY